MEHLAILSKKGKFLDKILSGEKQIESRWYKFKRPPFGSISKGDIIYFKESGEPVSAKANVEKVLTFAELNEKKIKEIIKKYGKKICIDLSYLNQLKSKKYCILIFLKKPKKIKSFEIDKTGYGNMTAWISIENINKIKRN
ncbi:ASCH domain-containing protein [Candidatus Micrarchaeota archaeon]|nr:ASCH domain-containing protein [Candidatus Micrarchaeota archaeon]